MDISASLTVAASGSSVANAGRGSPLLWLVGGASQTHHSKVAVTSGGASADNGHGLRTGRNTSENQVAGASPSIRWHTRRWLNSADPTSRSRSRDQDNTRTEESKASLGA